MAGTSAGGKKAAETRGHEDLSRAGKKGAEARHSKGQLAEREIAQKAAETRLKANPNAFKEMGEKGGRASKSRREEQE